MAHGAIGRAAELLAACALLACSGQPRERPEATAAPGKVEQAAVEAPAAKAEPPPAEPPPYRPPAGFREVKVEDAMPLCVFPSETAWFEAKHLRDVGKQRLRAGVPAVLGVFAPWCVHESCDQRPSLQCKVERQGDTLVVSSRYWGEHKDGSTCTTDCRSVTASCPTPALEAGEYTIRHGSETFTLEIPGVLTEPCFGSAHPPPAPPSGG